MLDDLFMIGPISNQAVHLLKLLSCEKIIEAEASTSILREKYILGMIKKLVPYKNTNFCVEKIYVLHL